MTDDQQDDRYTGPYSIDNYKIDPNLPYRCPDCVTIGASECHCIVGLGEGIKGEEFKADRARRSIT